jgi:hypothetical protein
MTDKLLDFNNPYTAFIAVSTAITILFVLARLVLKLRLLLWKGTLISFIIFIIFLIMGVAYEHSPLGDTPIYRMVFNTLSAILLVPGLLIYSLIPGVIKPCPSDFDVFGWHLAAFIFYAIVFWGVVKAIKVNKELNAYGKNTDNNIAKEPSSNTDSKES